MSSRPFRPLLFLAAFLVSPMLLLAAFAILARIDDSIWLVPAFWGLSGLPSYVFLGLPALWYAARRHGVSVPAMVAAALVANIGSPVILFIQAKILSACCAESFGRLPETWAVAALGWTQGFFYAAAFGAGVALLYRAGDSLTGRKTR